jgi:uncharacterized membrane protein
MRRENIWNRMVLGGLALALAPMPVSLDVAAAAKDGRPASGGGSGGRQMRADESKSAPVRHFVCAAGPADA